MGLKGWAHGKQRVRQIFIAEPQFASLALEALRWCLEERGIVLTEKLLDQAKQESSKYPKLTVKEFVESSFNASMQNSLE